MRAERLSFPLDYWNGLGIFVALGFPLLLGSALAPDRRRRALAVGVMPALGSVVYLTSSRGAVVALVAGVAVFVAAEPRRWAALVTVLAGTAGTAASIGVLTVWSDSWQAAVFIGLIGVGAAVGLERGSRVAPAPPAVSRGLVAAVLGALVAGAVGALLATDSLREFTRLPPAAPGAGGTHLLSGGGNGRWQFWQAAVDQFRSAPLHGGGAGSYESWWNGHGSFSYAVKNAHSLYVETLGELGLIGFLFLIGALGTAVAAGLRRLLRVHGSERTPIAALLGAATVFLIGAGVDWMWELPAVTIAGVCVLGLLAGPEEARVRGVRMRARIAAAAATCGVVVAEAVVLLAGIQVNESQAAARDGRLGSARAHAVAATRLEPWAATPYLQLALVEERSGDLAAARRSIRAAIQRDGDDWRPWLVAARIEQRLGHPAAATASRARARSLNPRSPIFSERR